MTPYASSSPDIPYYRRRSSTMTASFATYASQFLNRQSHPTRSTSESSSSQPLFYSFTTDNGSHAGNDTMLAHEDELDDEDDPHLRQSSDYLSSMKGYSSQHGGDADAYDEDDPYLRLDEEDHPLDASVRRLPADQASLVNSENPPPSQGWLAHQAGLSYYPSPSPPADSDSDSGDPPEFAATSNRNHPPSPPPPPRTRSVHPLTESLLPRDGIAKPVDTFSLPDPRHPLRGRAPRRDHSWTMAWLFSLTASAIATFVILFTTSTKRAPKGTIVPYTTLLHTIPLITILTFLSAAVSYAHIMLLRAFVKPVIFATSVFIPATLFVSAIWAFVGSFMWEEGSEPKWGETVGLRIFSLVPLVLALMTSRNLVHLPEELHSTSSILNLATQILLLNPFLLALSPLILLLSLLISIPFLTLAFRLLLIGYFTPTVGTVWEWHVRDWAGWSIAATVSFWLWSWGVARGILRVTCAGVIGAWYFQATDAHVRSPFDTYTVHAALTRSTDISLGSIVFSSLLLTGVRLTSLLAIALRRYTPLPLLPWLAAPIRFLGDASGTLSSLALVYVGLTGDAFMPSARRAQALSAAVHAGIGGGRVRYRTSEIDPSLSILTITPLTLTLPFALSAYLFVAHTLGAPGYASVAAFLAGGITALVGMFCVGLVEDAADSLYMCYCIDRDLGIVRKQEVNHAFEWKPRVHHPSLPRMDPAPVTSQVHDPGNAHILVSPPPQSSSLADFVPDEQVAQDHRTSSASRHNYNVRPREGIIEVETTPLTGIDSELSDHHVRHDMPFRSTIMPEVARDLSPPPQRIEEDEGNSDSMMMLGLDF